MTKKINKEILEFTKKIEPRFAELIHQKIIDNHKNIEVLDPAQLTIDVMGKMKEWFALLEKKEVGSQLEIEVLIALSARIMLLWWVREKTMDRIPVMNTGMLTVAQCEPNHKGEWCNTINSTCQEGLCSNCEKGDINV